MKRSINFARRPQMPRFRMKVQRLESEMPKLFRPEIAGQSLQIKIVVELSFLGFEPGSKAVKKMIERPVLQSNQKARPHQLRSR
jgi:hypothetical protein